MNKRVRVRIEWVPPSAGGRTAGFAGQRYSTVARFTGWPAPWEEGPHWSVVIDFGETDNAATTLPQNGFLAFLSPDAPDEVLIPGAHFELYEGRRRTAEGEVIEFVDSHEEQPAHPGEAD